MDDFESIEILTPNEKQEAKIDTLLQLLALFVLRFGGEVEISRHEFEAAQGYSVYARGNDSKLKLYLVDELANSEVDDEEE